jgi:hypothetical protein
MHAGRQLGHVTRTGGGESIEATARECDCEDRVTHTGSSGADGGAREGGDGIPACNEVGSSACNQGRVISMQCGRVISMQ